MTEEKIRELKKNMELRKLTIRDRKIITELFCNVFTNEPWNDDWSDTEQLNAYISDLTGQPYSLTLGYFDGDRVVGLAMGYIKHWYTGTEYIINEFCVDRKLQGKGIGSSFMKAIEAYLSENGICQIFLLTEKSVPAYSFYQHNGFTELAGNAAFAKRIAGTGRTAPEGKHTAIEFRKFSDFPKGTLYDILQDAYSFDARNRQIWDTNWKESDDFFYGNPDIADQYSLVTCLDGKPIGFVTWDPRNRPEYVEIGHNGIRERYKGRGYGKLQLEEAIRRIKTYEGLKRIIVGTNSNLTAPKNYESVGFVLYDRKPNDTESAYTGDFLWYEMIL